MVEGGVQAAGLHFLWADDARAQFVVDAAAAMNARLRIDGQALHLNHAIGTKYCQADHAIGEHSDKPLDIANDSFIVDLSFGDVRNFTLRERTPEEQGAWLLKNPKAAAERYTNHTGRTEDAVTMTDGSCVILSTSTNNRWVHAVPPPKHEGWSTRYSLVFRDIDTAYTRDEQAKRVAAARANKAKRDAAKA